MRVATANCLHGLDVRDGRPSRPHERALTELADGLARLDADVIALQEVDRGLTRSSGIDQVGWLAERLGMEGVFAAALVGDPDRGWDVPAEDAHDAGGGAYGIGMLSRFPVVGVHRRRLPGGGAGRRPPPDRRRRTGADDAGSPGWDREPRVALRADLCSPWGVLPVTTTHLSYLPWRGMRQLLAAAALAAAGDVTTVLLGDLNLPPWAVRVCLPGWRHAGGGPTYPADAPRMQVDHVLVRGGVASADAVTAAASTSDHLALVATLWLRHTVQGDESEDGKARRRGGRP